MNQFPSFLQKFGPVGESISYVFESFFDYIPLVFGALLLVFIGWLIAKAMRTVTVRVLKSIQFDALSEKLQLVHILEKCGLHNSLSHIFGALVYWVIYLIFVTTALETLQLEVVTESLYSLLRLIPQLVAAVLILVLAGVAARFVSDVVQRSAEGAGLSFGRVLGRLAGGVIILFMGIIALSTIGINTEILTSNLTLVIGGVVVAGAIAGGLGGRTVVENVLSANQLRGRITAGQKIVMDDLSGTVERIEPTAVVLSTESGILRIPASEFQRIPFVVTK